MLLIPSAGAAGVSGGATQGAADQLCGGATSAAEPALDRRVCGLGRQQQTAAAQVSTETASALSTHQQLDKETSVSILFREAVFLILSNV